MSQANMSQEEQQKLQRLLVLALEAGQYLQEACDMTNELHLKLQQQIAEKEVQKRLQNPA